ncbi:PTS IIA-like nitrogen regulatory protein PtsN [soil metagenome]|jgi:mannitol/fructose-specific phosphotransferase system IIA component (Ntr-type)
MAVVLADLLDEQHVTLELRARTRDEALREIVATMTGEEKVRDSEAFLAEVIAREEKITTCVGHGVAFPHARTDLVSEIVLGIGRSREFIPFCNGEDVNLIFLVGVPRRMVNDYLVCVGALARLVKDRRTREALMKTESAAEFLELLRVGSLQLE